MWRVECPCGARLLNGKSFETALGPYFDMQNTSLRQAGMLLDCHLRRSGTGVRVKMGRGKGGGKRCGSRCHYGSCGLFSFFGTPFTMTLRFLHGC